MDKDKIITFVKKNFVYFLIIVIAFVMGNLVGPSVEDLNAANKKTDEVKVELQQAEEMNATLEETNATLIEEKDKLVSENEKLQAKVDEATFWFELSDEQKQQIEADIKAEEEEAKAEEEAKVEQDNKLTEASNNATDSSSSSVTSTSSTVYTTPYGERYHLDPECGGKNSSATSKDNAIARGLTPCKKCAQ